MTKHSFKEYIEFLRQNLGNVIEYQECTGTLEPALVKINDDLFNEDPFIVFGASIQATKAFADKKLYH